MHSTAAGKPAILDEPQPLARRSDNVFTRKIWLPKLLYDVLPLFYIVAGVAAFAATLYISEWFWVLPHYLLFSVGCVHGGLYVFRRRGRALTDT